MKSKRRLYKKGGAPLWSLFGRTTAREKPSEYTGAKPVWNGRKYVFPGETTEMDTQTRLETAQKDANKYEEELASLPPYLPQNLDLEPEIPQKPLSKYNERKLFSPDPLIGDVRYRQPTIFPSVKPRPRKPSSPIGNVLAAPTRALSRYVEGGRRTRRKRRVKSRRNYLKNI
jgi:hypothetical protein